MPIPHSPRPHEDKDRIISEYILGSYELTAEDLADPAATANEIWSGLQDTNPDWFEQDGSINAEDVNITQADLEAYIARRGGE